jgi:hypothetical protein
MNRIDYACGTCRIMRRGRSWYVMRGSSIVGVRDNQRAAETLALSQTPSAIDGWR